MTGPLADGIHPASLGYQADPTRLSPNGAKKLLPPSTPARYDWDRTHRPEPKRIWDFGTVAHKLVLGEGDQFLILDPQIHGLKKDGCVADNPRATTTWKQAEANARAEGLAPIHVDDYGNAVAMAQAVHQHPTAGPLLADSQAEQWLYWHDPESGQGLRTRLDSMKIDDGRLTICEYKTAVDASPEVFGRRLFDYGYHIAAAFAVAAAKALGIDGAPAYYFIVQEKEPPYLTSVCELDPEAALFGERQMREAIRIYQQCKEADHWPGYPLGINTIPLPLWAVDDDEEMEFA